MLAATWYSRGTTTSSRSHRSNSRAADPGVLIQHVSGDKTSIPQTCRRQMVVRPVDREWTRGRQPPEGSVDLSGGLPCRLLQPVFPCGRFLRWVRLECTEMRRPTPDKAGA